MYRRLILWIYNYCLLSYPLRSLTYSTPSPWTLRPLQVCKDYCQGLQFLNNWEINFTFSLYFYYFFFKHSNNWIITIYNQCSHSNRLILGSLAAAAKCWLIDLRLLCIQPPFFFTLQLIRRLKRLLRMNVSTSAKK